MRQSGVSRTEIGWSRVRWVVALAAVAALASCSAVKLSYEKADWLLAQWAQRYVDLSAEQERALRNELADLRRWHRDQELPLYAQAFEDAAVQLEAGMTRAQIQSVLGTVRARARILGTHAGQSVAPLLASLSADQVREMEARFAADNRRFEKRHLSGDPSDRIERRSAWLVNQLEDWFGKLDPAQRARVDRLVEGFPDMPALRLAERKRRQTLVLEAAREGRAGGPAAARLTNLMADLERGRPGAVHESMVRWERAFIDMLVELEESLSPEQRAHGAQRLRRYAADFRELAARQTPGAV